MKMREKNKAQGKQIGSIMISNKLRRRRAAVVGLLALLVCAGVMMAAKAFYSRTAEFVTVQANATPSSEAPSPAEPLAATVQGISESRSPLHLRLALQPEADRMRRRLGQRFLKQGREVGVLSGTLTIGSSRQGIRITRLQGDDGEVVSMALDGGQPLSWDAREGAKVNGRTAGGAERSLIERIVLDSADQFVLGQLRSTSYALIARNAIPAEVKDPENYGGSTWDLYQVSEVEGEGSGKPESQYRLYFINSATRLIDKVLSKEGDDTIVAELLGWVEQGGEKMPSRIVWSRNQQPLMELVFNNVSYSAKQ
jgi:hypothetical protein